MSNSLIEFTKNMSGIDLVKYVLNSIDDNMILYSLLSMTEINSKINVIKDNFRVIYNIENIDEDNKRKLYETKSSSIKNEHDKNAIISYALLLLQHYGFRAEHDPRN